MKYVDEYRDSRLIDVIASNIHKTVRHNWNIMEICGGQTHSIMKYDLTSFLPDKINLIHGPGCPVCVTPAEKIDLAVHLAQTPGIILASFGDMVRVPGNDKDLLQAKAEGGDVRVVFSPLDCINLALENPDKQVVFFAIGFETTAPINALALQQVYSRNICNFSMLCSQVIVPPAMEYILSSPDKIIDGFLAAGHVCTVTGYHEYFPLTQKYKIPIAITGFEPLDILLGIYAVVSQLEAGTFEVSNEYKRSVTIEGNIAAQKTMNEMFEVCDQSWCGIGILPKSGLAIRKKYEHLDAEIRFSLSLPTTLKETNCLAGEILQGKLKPNQCPAFCHQCTPEHPLGAPMVSHEGACAAYYRYKTNHYGNKLSHTYTETR